MKRWEKVTAVLSLLLCVLSGSAPIWHHAKPAADQSHKLGSSPTWLDPLLNKAIAANLTPVTTRPTLNFSGAGFSVADDAVNNVTTVTNTAGTSPPVFFATLATLPCTTRASQILDGYATTGDGGGGSFSCNSSSTATPDGCTISAALTTGRWIRDAAAPLDSNGKSGGQHFNVQWCGATPSTIGGTKSTDAVMNAYAALPTTGGTLFFPASGAQLYYVPTTGTNPNGLKFTSKPVRLLGAYGRSNWSGSSPVTNALSRLGSDSNAPIVWFQNASGSYGSSIEHLGITGNATGTNQVGLLIDNRGTFAAFDEIGNVGGNGVEIRDCVACSFISLLSLFNKGNGWVLDSTLASSASPAVTNCTFVNAAALDNIGNGFLINTSAGFPEAGNVWNGGDSEANGKGVSGSPGGVVNITGATNANPTVIAVTAHGLTDGTLVNVNGVGGNTGANGIWYAKATGQDVNHYAIYSDFALTSGVDTSGGGAYTAGGHSITGWGFLLKGTGSSLATFNRGYGIWDELNAAGSIAFASSSSVFNNNFEFVKIGSGPDTSGEPFFSNRGSAYHNSNMVTVLKDLTQPLTGTAQTGRTQLQSVCTAGGYDSSDVDALVIRNRDNNDDGQVRMSSLVITKGLGVTNSGTDTTALNVPNNQAINIPWGMNIAAELQAGGGQYNLIQADSNNTLGLLPANGTNVYGPFILANTGSGTCRIFGGTGAPSAGLGSNGDFYFRQDGGTGTAEYQKRSGSWVAIL